MYLLAPEEPGAGNERRERAARLADEKAGMIDEAHCGIMNELYLKYLERCRLSACICTNLRENRAASAFKRVGKEQARELIEQSGH